ncbi:MAG: sulfotransferase [Gammaproteobacteria bacterium]
MSGGSNPMQQVLVALKAGDAVGAIALLDGILNNEPEHGPALVMKARLVRQSGDLNTAKVLLDRAQWQVGDHPQFLSERGYLALATGDGNSAIHSFESLIQHVPDYADAHFNLGHAYRLQGRVESAVISFERALELGIAQPHEAYTELGNTLLMTRREEEAQAHFESAIALRPGYSRALFGLGSVCAARGDFEQAQAHFRHALDDEPSFVEAFQQIAEHRRFTSFDDPDVVAMLAASRAPDVSPYQLERLHFALGKAADDCAHYDEAFDYYTRANLTKRSRSLRYDRRRHEELIDRIIEVFEAPRPARHAAASDSALPLVIVGMPRSGTTLLETMLARHSNVDAGGELSYFERVVRPALAPYPEGLDSVDETTARELAVGYLEELEQVGAAAYITDKYPANFLHLGTIAALLPNASLIHCRRHPLDTCLSIYFQDFASGNDYANDLDDISHYYAQYQRLMEHWRELLGGRLLEVEYEDVVDDQASQLERLLAHCSLPYEERCLNANYDPSMVSTLSRWQVRQPVYSRSKERWRHYRAHVEHLADALGVELG